MSLPLNGPHRYYGLPPRTKTVRETILDRDQLQHHEIDELFDDFECLTLNGVDTRTAMVDVFDLDPEAEPMVLFDTEIRRILHNILIGD